MPGTWTLVPAPGPRCTFFFSFFSAASKQILEDCLLLLLAAAVFLLFRYFSSFSAKVYAQGPHGGCIRSKKRGSLRTIIHKIKVMVAPAQL